MKNFRITVLILLVAIATPFALHRRVWALHMFTGNQAAEAGGTSLRIVSPKQYQNVGDAYVAVQYEKIPTTSSSDLSYELRLDGRDPVHTKDTNYIFDGLVPGKHNLVVQAVDSNGIPVSGTRSEVQFSATPSAVTSKTFPPTDSNAPTIPPFANDLPNGNGSLPLLSIIGFGILVGGVISALRTRPAHK